MEVIFLSGRAKKNQIVKSMRRAFSEARESKKKDGASEGQVTYVSLCPSVSS